MEAVKFFEVANRYCDMIDCTDCEIIQDYGYCINIPKTNAEHIVDLIERWANEHIVKTNKQKYKEIFGGNYKSLPCPPLDCPNTPCSECLKWWDEEYIEPKK